MNLHDRDIQRAARREGIAEGIEQGARETAIENAKNFYKNGVSKEIIAKSLNMSLDEVDALLEGIDI